MADTELKPCPFCGANQVRIVYWDEENQQEKAWEKSCEGTMQDENHYLVVRCYSCDIEFFGGVPIKVDELIKRWNRRADSKTETWECQGNIGG